MAKAQTKRHRGMPPYGNTRSHSVSSRSRILEWHAEGRLADDVLLSRDGQTWRRVRWPAARKPGRGPGRPSS